MKENMYATLKDEKEISTERLSNSYKNLKTEYENMLDILIRHTDGLNFSHSERDALSDINDTIKLIKSNIHYELMGNAPFDSILKCDDNELDKRIKEYDNIIKTAKLSALVGLADIRF